jgi:hypothetical protein
MRQRLINQQVSAFLLFKELGINRPSLATQQVRDYLAQQQTSRGEAKDRLTYQQALSTFQAAQSHQAQQQTARGEVQNKLSDHQSL